MWSESESHSVVSDSLRPHGLNNPWNSPGQNTGVGCLSLLQGNFPNPGIKPRSPALQEDSLPTEPSGKPKNTGVGSLSLLQGNLPNPGIEPRSPALQVGSLPAEPPERSVYLHLFLVLVCTPLTTMRLSTFSCACWPFRPLRLWSAFLSSYPFCYLCLYHV